MISAIGSDVATWHPLPPSYEMHGDGSGTFPPTRTGEFSVESSPVPANGEATPQERNKKGVSRRRLRPASRVRRRRAVCVSQRRLRLVAALSLRLRIGRARL